MDLKDVGKKSRLTLTWLRDHHLTASPINYIVGYSFVNNESPSLRQEIKLAQKLGELESYDFKGLFRRHLLNRIVPKIASDEGFKKILDETNKSISVTKKNLSDYSVILFENRKLLSKEGNAVNVELIIQTLVHETEVMHEKTRMLEAELAKANDEISTLREQFEEAEQKAKTDDLSELLNREGLQKEYAEYLANHTESLPLSCAMIDIDQFKSFNDMYGHDIGNDVIRAVSKELKNGVRSSDAVARYGGEEFVILLPKANSIQAQKVSEILRIKISELKINVGRIRKATLTVSIGVTTYERGENFDKMLERASEALFKAKAQGRNRVVVGG